MATDDAFKAVQDGFDRRGEMLDDLTLELKAAKKALRFYADPDNWYKHMPGQWDKDEFVPDDSSRACAALEEK